MKTFNDPAMILEQTPLVDTFLWLVRQHTTSDPKSETHPSSSRQIDALKRLKDKLLEMGLTDVELDENGYLFASLPGNVDSAPTIGLLAHIDTAPDFSGENIQPILHENYQGQDLELKNDVVISPEQSKELLSCKGDTIITADGTTLLGADDKAGIAEILAAIHILQQNPEIKRPTLRIGFTPDEEIGQGASLFDLKRFGAELAYTVDGSFSGEVNSETFCADAASVSFTGVMVHPGYAKGKLVNALRYAGKLLDRLPNEESPEGTEGREGFYHPTGVEGGASEATVSMILRDFDPDQLAQRGERLKKLVAEINAEEPRLKTEVTISETYRNMGLWLQEKPKVTERLIQAVKDADIEPNLVPIRGGTDGSVLTEKGLPCPNIFAGGVNFHGPREWVSTRVMAQAVCVLLNLAQRFVQ